MHQRGPHPIPRSKPLPSRPPSPSEAPSIDEKDQNVLNMLTSTFACLKQANRDVDALGYLEQSLWLQRRMFGVQSPAVRTTLNDVVLSYNALAMQALAQDRFNDCVALLRKAEAIVAPKNFWRAQALQILTFNNMGCCYRKVGHFHLALQYLQKAARIGSTSVHVHNLALTHLNLCAIHSQFNRHDVALEHAQAAIFHTQEELVRLDLTTPRDGKDDLDPRPREEKIVSLAVAYHNLGVELEFTHRGDASVQWYQKALQLMAPYRATNQTLFDSFRRIVHDAKAKYQAKSSRQTKCSEATVAAPKIETRRPKSAHATARCTKDGDVRDLSYTSTVASQCYRSNRRVVAARRGGSSQRARHRVPPKRPKSAQSAVWGKNGTASQDFVGNLLERHWEKLEEKHNLKNGPIKIEKTSCGRRTSALTRRNQTQQQQKDRHKQLYLSALDSDFNEDDGDLIDAESESELLGSWPCSYTTDHEMERSRKRPNRAIGSTHRGGRNASHSFEETAVKSCSEICANEELDVDLPAQRVGHLEYLRRMKKLADNIKDDLNGLAGRVDTVTHVQPGTAIAPLSSEYGSKASTPRRARSKLRDEIEQARRESSDHVETLTRVDDEGLELFEGDNGSLSECKDKLHSYREAAVCRLQIFFRRQRKATHLKQIQRTNESATVIQRQVRRHLKGQQDERRIKDEESQIKLQKLEVEDMAACLIQRLWRRALGRNTMKSTSIEHSNVSGNIVPILSLRSVSNDRQEMEVAQTEQQDKEEWERPTVCLEKHTVVPSISPRDDRFLIPTRTSSRMIEDRQKAAIRIQAFIKSVIVRDRLALENARDFSRMYIERQHFSVTLNRAMALEQEFLEKLCVVKIQALVRGRQSRLLSECFKAGISTAATTLQRAFRVYRQRRRQAEVNGVRSIAARTIQQSFREHEARKSTRHQIALHDELSHVHQIAANSIQRFWKQHIFAFHRIVEKVEAATCIQALGRGHLTRKLIKALHTSSVFSLRSVAENQRQVLTSSKS